MQKEQQQWVNEWCQLQKTQCTCFSVDVVLWDTQLWMNHVCTGVEGIPAPITWFWEKGPQ